MRQNQNFSQIFTDDDYMKQAEELESKGQYEKAYATCKAAMDFVTELEKTETDYDTKRFFERRIELWSLRTEKLFNMYLAPEVKDLRTKSDPIMKKDILQKPTMSEIYKYSVIRKGNFGMLVSHTDTQKTFYVKVLNKTTTFSDEDLIIPENIPYMVQLHNFYNCENSIFLILEYINGLKLSDYLNKMRLKFENNETLENLYDKAADLDIPDDDSESSFSELVTNYTKIKEIGVVDDFVHITKEDTPFDYSENRFDTDQQIQVLLHSR